MNNEDIDQLIINYNKSPSSDNYFAIYSWYKNNKNIIDKEYGICVYLFLLGANIKKRYTTVSYEDHINYIKEIRKLIEDSPVMYKNKRKIYLDYGLKPVL